MHIVTTLGWTLATLLVCGASLAGWTPLARAWWRLEILSHFRPQFAVGLAVWAAAILMLGHPALAGLALACAALNGAGTLSVFVGPGAPAGRGAVTRAAVANILHRNRRATETTAVLRGLDADLLLLIEVSPTWLRRLEPLVNAYPHRVVRALRRGWGMALLSRAPLGGPTFLRQRTHGVLGLLARVEAAGGPITVIGAHPFAPVDPYYAQARNRQLAALAAVVRAQAGPVLMLGDLNISPWSPYFGDLLADAGLRDSRRGHGVHGTWPVWWPGPRIPIDHCLVSPEVAIHRRQLGPRFGSDHLPVVVEFSCAHRMENRHVYR